MAEVKKQSKQSRKRSADKSNKVQRPRKKPVANAVDKSTPVLVAEEQAKLSVAADPMVDGAERLRNSMNQKVAEKADLIANGLADKAAKGSSTCAKLLWDVINEKQLHKTSSKRMSEYLGMLESEAELVKQEANDLTQTESSDA